MLCYWFDIGWYLIDHGPMTRMKPAQGAGSTVSDESLFFDLTALRSAVPVITAKEFFAREHRSVSDHQVKTQNTITCRFLDVLIYGYDV